MQGYSDLADEGQDLVSRSILNKLVGWLLVGGAKKFMLVEVVGVRACVLHVGSETDTDFEQIRLLSLHMGYDCMDIVMNLHLVVISVDLIIKVKQELLLNLVHHFGN